MYCGFYHADTGKGDYTVVEGQFVPKAPMFIPRADVANYMLSSLQRNDWDRKCMAIGGKAWHGIWTIARIAQWLVNTFFTQKPCEATKVVKRKV